MLGLLVATADRAVAIESGLAKLVLLLFAGIYISLAARTAASHAGRRLAPVPSPDGVRAR